MIHVTSSCNPAVHHTGAHYLNGDTTAFMQLLQGDLFADFPSSKLVIPHGGGAVPFHWGRYPRPRAGHEEAAPRRAPDGQRLLRQLRLPSPGIELLAKVISPDNILFASEMLGAVKGIDPETGHHYDDTKRYFDQLGLSAADRHKIFEGNARRVYPRLDRRLARKAST
jgi:4-oxalmesaconate hydratase